MCWIVCFSFIWKHPYLVCRHDIGTSHILHDDMDRICAHKLMTSLYFVYIMMTLTGVHTHWWHHYSVHIEILIFTMVPSADISPAKITAYLQSDQWKIILCRRSCWNKKLWYTVLHYLQRDWLKVTTYNCKTRIMHSHLTNSTRNTDHTTLNRR